MRTGIVIAIIVWMLAATVGSADDLPVIEPGDTYMSSAMSIYRCQEQVNQLYDELVYNGQWNAETVEGITCRPTDDGFNGCECTVKFCKDGTK